MKKLSEVSRLTGITRRALQGYDEIGLLHPSAIQANGYWLYDNDAIRKLFVIKTLAEGGYTRKRMKEFFESSSADMMAECDSLIASLEKERRLISGKIRTIRMLKVESQLSDTTREILARMGNADLYENRSFASCFDSAAARMATLYGEVDALNLEAYLAFWCTLATMGLLDESDSTATTHAVANDAFTRFVVLMNAIGGCTSETESLGNSELQALFPKFVETFLADSDMRSTLELACGEGACAKIACVIHDWNPDES